MSDLVSILFRTKEPYTKGDRSDLRYWGQIP